MSEEITTTTHADRARRMAQQVREIVSGIEGFVFITPGEKVRITGGANVSDEFMALGAVALEQTPLLAQATPVTPESVRDSIEFSQAIDSFADELARMERGARETAKVRRAATGTEVLRIYGVAKELNRPGDRVESIPWVAKMQAALNRGRKKVRKQPEGEELTRKLAGGAK